MSDTEVDDALAPLMAAADQTAVPAGDASPIPLSDDGPVEAQPTPAGTDPTSEVAPAASEVPSPRTFTTRAEFLIEREAMVARVDALLADDDDGTFERHLLAEVYAATIELRLALGDLAVFTERANGMMTSGMGKALGKVIGRG